ncbi:MAG: IS1634 family transposase [Chloroflexi bacterium]|nr:IS1634 family transposase [Chloroflexota bacterium]
MEKIEVGEVQVERLDDIPVIIGHLQKMHIQAVIDRVIKPHGNWEGLSPGWIISIWLIHILSEHGHCMDRVREWVSKRLHILQELTGQALTELDFTDDRLALCLRKLSQIDVWQEIEAQLGTHILRVYRLGEEPTVRLDATTGTVNHDPGSHTLFQVGKAKNGQYETQYKMMLVSLDPLGLPLAVDVVPGERADDPLYLPCYQRVKRVLSENGVLVVGDSKMSALHTRATMVAGDDFYLTPLAHLKDEPGLLEELLTPWVEREDEMEHIFLPEDGQDPDLELAIGHGFEVNRTQQGEVVGQDVVWRERLLVVRSHQYEKTTKKWLHRRLEKAEKALKALTPPRGRGKRQIKDEASLLAAIQRIEEKYREAGLFDYHYEQEVMERRVRAYGDKPARTERKVRFHLTVTRNQQAIAEAEFKAGWRIYATNAPGARLPLGRAVLAYRDQYIEENIFRRLQGKILSITPVYVQRDDHAKGLFHLLTLAARLLALGDHLAKQTLAQEETELAGIYPGNPKRSTATPTTERMLAAFDNINLTIVPVAGQMHYQVTPLTAVQRRILELWKLPVTLYTQFSA